MSAALAMVKRELGADAVILHTRTMSRGGIFGIRAKQFIEITASNDVKILSRARRESTGAGRAPAQAPAGATAARNPLLKRTYNMSGGPAASAAPVKEQSFGDAIRSASPTVPLAAMAASPAISAVPEQLAEDVRQIHRMVDRMMRRQAAAPAPDLPDALMQQYLALLQQEVSEELAEEVLNGVKEELTPDQLRDVRSIREAVQRRIAKLIPSDAGSLVSGNITRPADGRPLTIALIGPTGVGKTTTLAKLAATFKLRHKKKVAMLTIDTYRIAAVDQLKTYAEIIQVPVHVAMTPGELREKLALCRGCDVVLIDTAGRSQRDEIKLKQLNEFLDVANPHQVHLVLSGTSSQGVLMEAANRFSSVRTDRVIFTKLDEAVNFGVLLNVVRKVNKQLSYVTTGQEVPHQIEAGRSERLAGLILGEKL